MASSGAVAAFWVFTLLGISEEPQIILGTWRVAWLGSGLSPAGCFHQQLWEAGRGMAP